MAYITPIMCYRLFIHIVGHGLDHFNHVLLISHP